MFGVLVVIFCGDCVAVLGFAFAPISVIGEPG
jgi:hypothetical protein